MHQKIVWLFVLLLLGSAFMIVDADGAGGITGEEVRSDLIHNIQRDTYHQTIQSAIDNADTGDTIMLGTGIYKENLVIDKPITLRGIPDNLGYINGDSVGDVISIRANGVKIDGLSISGEGGRAGISIISPITDMVYEYGPGLYPSSFTPRQLTFHEDYEGAPAFSPDGTKIAYQRYDISGTNNIWIMDSDGMNNTQLTFEGKHEEYPNFSPEEDLITYVSMGNAGVDSQIFIMDLDGTNKTLVTTEDHRYDSPTFHPTNGRIYYVNDDLEVKDIFSMERDGTDVRRVTDFGDVFQGFCISPDGRDLIYQTYDDETWKMDMGTKKRTILGDSNSYGLEYSDDGGYVVYFTRYYFDIHIMDSDGQNIIELISNNRSTVSPSINGDYDIVYESDQDMGKYRDIWMLEKRPFIENITFSGRQASHKTKVEVNFNSAMDTSTLTDAFEVREVITGNVVDGEVTWNVDKNGVTFTSKDILMDGIDYIVNISYDLQNHRGHKLEKNYSWKFLVLDYTPVSSSGPIVISNCTIKRSDYGILINSTKEVQIHKNHFTENDLYSIHITNSSACEIYHNQFYNSEVHAYDDSQGQNHWDNGYPSGGNYWDDMEDVDEHSGPDQDLEGSDRIFDTPYIISPYVQDHYPYTSWFLNLDQDNDGTIDIEDQDDDGDGVPDIDDTFPLDPYESQDTDGDLIGDNEDTDDDDDGILDYWEDLYGLNRTDATDAETDLDGDGYTNLQEFESGTDPQDADSKPSVVGNNGPLIILAIIIATGISITTLWIIVLNRSSKDN